MNTSKSIIASVVTAIIVVLLGFAILPHSTVIQNPSVMQKVGGAPDLSNSPYIDINGYVEWYSQVAMAQGNATTTLCSFQAPSASSSIDRVLVRFGGITSSAITFSVGTSTTAQGSTGTLATGVSAGTSTVYSLSVPQASSTPFSAGNFLNVVISSLATTTSGQCMAKFTQL